MTHAMQAFTCPECKGYMAALALWTAEGGALPSNPCPAGSRAHRMARCRDCRRTYAAACDDGRCDECWGKQERAERPLGPR